MMLHIKDVFELYENPDNQGLSWKGLILKALSYGDIHISVHDGEVWEVSKSRDRKKIMDCVQSVDECTLGFWSTKKAVKHMLDKDSEERHKVTVDDKTYWYLGDAYINLWNDLDETVSNYTANDYMELLITNPNYKEKSYA